MVPLSFQKGIAKDFLKEYTCLGWPSESSCLDHLFCVLDNEKQAKKQNIRIKKPNKQKRKNRINNLSNRQTNKQMTHQTEERMSEQILKDESKQKKTTTTEKTNQSKRLSNRATFKTLLPIKILASYIPVLTLFCSAPC